MLGAGCCEVGDHLSKRILLVFLQISCSHSRRAHFIGIDWEGLKELATLFLNKKRNILLFNSIIRSVEAYIIYPTISIFNNRF